MVSILFAVIGVIYGPVEDTYLTVRTDGPTVVNVWPGVATDEGTWIAVLIEALYGLVEDNDLTVWRRGPILVSASNAASCPSVRRANNLRGENVF